MTDEVKGAAPTQDKGAAKLSCRNLWKVYGPDAVKRFQALSAQTEDPSQCAQQLRDEGLIVAASNVSFDVPTGEIFVIMGLSGSGKSTVVRCLSRLVEPTGGEVLLDGEDLLQVDDKRLIEIRRKKMGMVFQSFGLLPHLTVLENVAFPLKIQGVGLNERMERAERVIELVGLQGREQSFPHQLSGGQQQRVGIARSLAVEPELWFLDEPFSALDPLIRRQMQDEFLRLQRMLHKSIVFITHDFLEALRIADRMAIMRGGEVVQTGTPEELVLNPADSYVAEFTSDVPLLRVLCAEEAIDKDASPLADAPKVPGNAVVEDILEVLSANEQGVNVVGKDDMHMGVITSKSLIAALSTRAPHREEEPA